MRFNGFNRQICRQRVFTQLLDSAKFDLIIETGTYEGETAGYMAELSGLKVFTCDTDHERLQTAKERLEGLNVSIHETDSCEFLRRLARVFADRCTFFYLDAHSWGKIPLAAEVELVTANWKSFIALIDDFKVPGDDGYGFNDYGPKNAICFDMIAPIIKRRGIHFFFPNTPSSEETGERRGSIFLCSEGEMTEIVNTCWSRPTNLKISRTI